MNNWNAIGYIALGFTIIFLCNLAYILFDQRSAFVVALPWLNYLALSLVVAIVCFVKGMNLTITSKTSE
jgi:hypothetical protein